MTQYSFLLYKSGQVVDIIFLINVIEAPPTAVVVIYLFIITI